ncbi:V-type ATP synthase subunit C [Microaceticoccus formicicus]|uniref:V-type ATP synthase subunit C n=1 Tax=Microaceticoccus formicicus TaxID=3118105 RepID=UPI003CD02B78|nr:V-type ATP synthase subunit C [Peptoniphilaceae bacterium AMB_02]
MKREDFIQSSTRIRVLESKLLTKDQFNRMVEAKDMDEVLRVLNETAYANSFNKLERPEDYEEALGYEIKKLYRDVKEISPYPEIVEFASLKYDAHNFKVLFKDHILGRESDELLIDIGKIDINRIESKADAGDRKGIDRYYDNIATDIVSMFETTTDPQYVELVVDLHFYETMLKMANQTKSERFIKYAKDYIDFSNIKAIFRMKKQDKDLNFADAVLVEGGNISVNQLKAIYFEPIDSIVQKLKLKDIGKSLYKGFQAYEQTGRLSEFEKAMDDYQLNFMKDTKLISYGPEVILAYIFAKETEIKNIRIILVSKLNKLSPEFIRERLRDIYV